MNIKEIDTNIKISTVGKDDYPELEGKVIEYTDNMNSRTQAVVVGCNRSVGCTIVKASDKNYKLLCYVGKVAPGYERGNDALNMLIFDYVVKGIKAGHVNFSQILKDSGTHESGGAMVCAYSQ